MADRICELVASNAYGLEVICSDYPELPSPRTIDRWQVQHPEFCLSFARAREARGDLLFDQQLDIADDGSADYKIVNHRTGDEVVIDNEAIARSRLRVETRRAMAAKLKPKVYGDRTTIDLNVAIDVLPYDALLERFHDLLRTGHLQLPEGVEIIEPEERDDSDLA